MNKSLESRGARTVLGAMLSLLMGTIAVLRIPADVADIATSWSSFHFSAPPETVRLVIVAALGVAASVLLAPGVADLISAIYGRRRERRERTRRDEVAQAEAERRVYDHREKIRDYLNGLLSARPDYRAVLSALIEGPTELDTRRSEFLESMAIVEGLAYTESNNTTVRAIFRLTEIARPVVEESLRG